MDDKPTADDTRPRSSLLDQCEEAKQYVELATEDLRKRFPSGFTFAKAVLWSDFLTPEGEICGGDDPHRLAEEISANGLPINNQHDPTQPAGWTFCASVFRTNDNSTVFVAGVIGCYEFAEVETLAEMMTRPEIQKQRHVDLRIPPEVVTPCVDVCLHHRELDLVGLEEILSRAPTPINREPVLEFRHSDGSLVQTLSVWVPVYFLLWNPFVRRILERGADAVCDAIGAWLMSDLIPHYSAKSLNGPLFDMQSNYRQCSVRLIVKSNDKIVLTKALERRAEAAERACEIIELACNGGIQLHEVVFVFLPVESSWRYSHATRSDGGIVTYQKSQFTYGRLGQGLSLGGTYGRGTSSLSRSFRLKQLEDALRESFTNEELVRCIRSRLTYGAEIADCISSNLPPATYVHEVVRALNRYNAINDEFFDAICMERPQRAAIFGDLRQLWADHNP